MMTESIELNSKMSAIEARMIFNKRAVYGAESEQGQEAMKQLEKFKVLFVETPNWPNELKAWIALKL